MQKIIYTTNAVEAVHRQFRKLTKTKGGFANENSLLKLLYASIMRATERWTHPVQNWNLTLSQMAIHFGDRISISSHVNLWPWLTQRFEHPLLRQRIYALCQGYEDLNDHNDLLRDPTCQTTVGQDECHGDL